MWPWWVCGVLLLGVAVLSLIAYRHMRRVIRKVEKAARQEIHAVTNSVAARLAVLEHLPMPLMMVDQQLIVVRANIAALELFGDDIAGKPIAVLLPDHQALQTIQSALTEKVRASCDTSRLHPVEQVFRLLAQPIPPQPNTRTRLVITLHDITAVQQTQRSNAAFVANASHELRTPLTAIMGFIETLQGAAKDDEAARVEFLAIMQAQARRMARLINDLLSLSRIERHVHVPVEDYIRLQPLLQNSVEAMRLRAAEKGLEIRSEWSADAVTVVGDADELGQMFQNLLDNAVKYSDGLNPVQLRVMVREDKVAVSVRNSGEGIALDEIPRLTERFYRSKSARSSGIDGTGLGLAIVKHTLSRHGGQLEISSILGEYAEFTVLLPLAPPQPPG